jgi:4-diphosphocytidyl-2C-methyl-D-erythritol kinase
MAIETEVEVLKSVVSKLDTSIEKITQVSGDIGKILAVHEQRLDSIEKVSEYRNEEIKEIHSRITTQTREVVEKIDQLQSRLEHKMNASAVAAKEQHESIQKEIQQDLQNVASILDKDIKEVTKRVDVLENWRWMIVGGAIVFGFVVGNSGLFTKIFG